MLITQVNVEASGGDLNVPVQNQGTFTVSGEVTSYADGDAFINNGNMTIQSGVALRGMDTGGQDFAFVQGYGTTNVAGTLDFTNGSIRVEGGELNWRPAG